MSLSLPSTFANRYTIEDLIGGGSFARTYIALDTVLQRRVAMKILRHEYLGVEEFTNRFDREAQAAARVSHVNVVSVYDFGRESGIPFIVMQYVDGPSLRAYMRDQGPLTIEESINFSRQILEGLAAIHDEDIVHRDVKPQNVLLEDAEVAKLTDFGVAFMSYDATLTDVGTTVGTAAYMAPEQASGAPVSPQTDLYAVGVILYELLTGRLPFQGNNPVQIMYRHVSEMPTPPRALNRQIPMEIEAVILRGLAKSPADRYRDTRAMRDALVRASGAAATATRRSASIPQSNSRAPTGRQSARRPPIGPPPRSTESHAGGGGSRRWPLFLFLALLVLFVASAAGYVLADGLGLVGTSDDTPTSTESVVELPTAEKSPTPVETATVTTTATIPAPTSTATLTPEPTATEEPSPTEVPSPTATIAPTETPEPVPTATQIPDPTSTPSVGLEFDTPFPGRSTPPQWTQGPSDTLARDDFVKGGAYRRDDGVLYGRPAAHLYSQATKYPATTVMFKIDDEPGSYIGIVITGMDDERDAHVPCRLSLNGNVVWEGPSPFANQEWTTIGWSVGNLDWVHKGNNKLTFEILAEDGEFGLPPWILLNEATVYWN